MKKNKDQVVGRIYETKNYSKFKHSKTNRKCVIKPSLKKNIQQNGLLNPICVDEKTLTVMNGQHRLLVCKELGINVKYFFNNAKITDLSSSIRAMNSDQINWSPRNYLDSFCSEEKVHYEEFKRMMIELNISCNALYKALRSKELQGQDLVAFKSGNLILNEKDLEIYNTIVKYLPELQGIHKLIKKTFSRRGLICGAVEIFQDSKYKHNKLLDHITNSHRNFYAEASELSTPEAFKNLLKKYSF